MIVLKNIAAALVLAVFALPAVAEAQTSRSGGGVKEQARVAVCLKEFSELQQRIVTIQNLVGTIKNCHNQQMLFDGTGCVEPTRPDHQWHPSNVGQVRFQQADGSFGGYIDIRGPRGEDATCPAGTTQR